jgi:N-methylhydantoinase B
MALQPKPAGRPPPEADATGKGAVVTTRQRADPVAGALIRRLIQNAAREMGITLIRATRSPVLFEARDFATGIFDRDGRVLEQHQYLPLMAFCLGPAVEAVIDAAGSAAQPGDVFIHNDPYTGGTHAMDVAVVRPVFRGRALHGWTACKGHMMDWGGPVPSGYNASARSRWDEPLRIPAVRLYTGGRRSAETWRLISTNVREADIVQHDLEAMVGSTEIGARRLVELIERFGPDEFDALADVWLTSTRNQVRKFVRSLPDGTYRGASEVIDSSGRRSQVNVAIEIAGARMTFDFDGTSPQTETFVNAPKAVTRGGVLQCMAMILGTGVDLNAGFAEPFTVRLPRGSLLSAEYPAAVGYCLHLTDQISAAVFGALSKVVPDRVIAGWLQWGTSVSGIWQGREFSTPLFFPSKGGSGATHGADGYDYIGSIRMAGALESEDVEMFERVHGWMEIQELSYWPDSGGRGQWRGGLGAYSRMVLLGEDMQIAVFGTGRDAGAPGLFGGEASPRSRMEVHLPDGSMIDVPAMANIGGLPAGTAIRKWNTGGGGLGPPSRRDRSLVEADTRAGYVTESRRDNER